VPGINFGVSLLRFSTYCLEKKNNNLARNFPLQYQVSLFHAVYTICFAPVMQLYRLIDPRTLIILYNNMNASWFN